MRNFTNWLKAFVSYASYGEAPLTMYFWVGVSTLAGALRRQVWIDMGYFRWLSNFYVVLVAPPGVVAKSTTATIGMELLREISYIKFGPDVVTWQALVQSLAGATEAFEFNGSFYPMSAITIESSEFGNFLNPNDREMVDLLVSLWDGKKSFEKVTKMSGNDKVQAPWVNILACTTPAWISGNFPEYMIGGGFTSRCVFVYADSKRQFVAYPKFSLPPEFQEMRLQLIEDLEKICQIKGPYELDPQTVLWGEKWYEAHYKNRPAHLDNERFGGYIARKQTHIHKLAMVIAAAQRDERVVLMEDLESANALVSALETSMPQVFSQIGRTDNSRHLEEMLGYIRSRKTVSYTELYRNVIRIFPSARELEDSLAMAVRAGYVRISANGTEQYVTWVHADGN